MSDRARRVVQTSTVVMQTLLHRHLSSTNERHLSWYGNLALGTSANCFCAGEGKGRKRHLQRHTRDGHSRSKGLRRRNDGVCRWKTHHLKERPHLGMSSNFQLGNIFLRNDASCQDFIFQKGARPFTVKCVRQCNTAPFILNARASKTLEFPKTTATTTTY